MLSQIFAGFLESGRLTPFGMVMDHPSKLAFPLYQILSNLSGLVIMGEHYPKIPRIFLCQDCPTKGVWKILKRQGVLGDWEIHTNDDTPTVAVNFGLEIGPSEDPLRRPWRLK